MNRLKIYNKSEARQKFPSLVKEVNDSSGAIYISERGEKQAVLISYKAFLKLYKPVNQAKKLVTFAGIWKDREDLIDTVKWVNNIREKYKRRIK